MSNNLVRMQEVRGILQLLQKGYSGRKISRELGLSRNRAKLYTDRFTSCAYNFEQLQQMDDAGLHGIAYADAEQVRDDERTIAFKLKVPDFLAELKRTGVTKYLSWQEYKKSSPEGFGHSQFCDLFAGYRKVHEASIHLEHAPAAVMMIDFVGDCLNYVDKGSGELIKCPMFVAVLPCSGYSFAVALPDATQPYVIKPSTCASDILLVHHTRSSATT